MTVTATDRANAPYAPLSPLPAASAPKATLPRLRLPVLLLLLFLAGLLPALALGGIGAWQAVRGEQKAAEARLRDTARALALAVDRMLAARTDALTAFAASPAFGPDPAAADLTELDRHARIMAERLGGAMYVARRDGQLVLSTRLAPGAALPRTTAPYLVDQVFAAGRPAVSNLMIGAISGQKVLSVAAPVPDADGRVALAAAFTVGVDRLRDLLAAQGLPEGSFAAVTDAQNVVVARSDALHGSLVGRPAPPEGVRQFAGRDAGLYRMATLDGTERVIAFQAVMAAPGWRVFVAEPTGAFDAAWRAPLLALVLGGALALALGAGLALVAARGVLVPLRRLTQHAEALAGAAGSAPSVTVAALPSAPIAELEALRRGFAEAEAALTARKDELRALFRASPVGIVHSDAGGRVHAANDAFLQIVGMTREDLATGRIRWDELTPPESLRADETAIAEAVASPDGRCRPYEKEYVRLDGTRVPVLLSFALTDRATGQAACFVVDLTEVRRAEASLVENERRLRETLTTLDLGAFMTRDPNGTIRYWSQGCERLYGWTAEEAVGQVAHDLLRTRFPEPLDRIEARLACGGEWAGELRHRTKAGQEVTVAARMVMRPVVEGRPPSVLESMADVTAQRRAEAALARQAERRALLLEVSRDVLAVEGDEAALTRAVFNRVAAHLGVDLCFHYALEEDGAVLRLVAAPGLTPEHTGAVERLRSGEALCGIVAATGRPLSVGAERLAHDEAGAFLKGLGVTAYACQPLLGRDGRMIGTLSLASRARGVFDDGELELLQTLAGFVALAVQARRAVTELRRSEAFGRSILCSTTDCMAVLDSEGRLTFMNEPGRCQKELTDLAGVLGRPVVDLWPEESRPQVEAALAGARAGRPARYTAFGPTAKGTPKWWDVTVTPLPSPDGGAPCILSVARDITEARRADQALRDSEAQFRAVAEAIPGFVFATDAEGLNTYTNARFQEYTGLSAEALLGDGWLRVLHPDDRDRAAAVWDAAVRGGEFYEIEYRLRRAGGAYRWFLGRGAPVRDEVGRVTAWFGTCTDIEEMVEAREVLARSHEELEQLIEARTHDLQETQARLAHAQRMEAIGQLAGGIAHDFNNVIQAVQGGAALIERRPADPDGVRRLARMVAEAAGRGASITRRLLAFSRRGDLRTEMVDPVALLTGMHEVLTHTLGTGIGVRVEAARGLPPLLADKGQLETVLVNLATNARDAMGGNGSLTLAAAIEVLGRDEARQHPAKLEPGSYVRLSVTDAGSGMPPEVLARVTEPFFTTKEHGKGTGLGLAMAKGFAEQSGGALHIDSAPGEGTTVTLWFPRAEGALTAAPPAEGVAPLAEHRRVRVLVVEDDAIVREVTAEGLQAEGYAVLVAADGPAALALLDEGEAVDMLISDLSMPGMDGITVIREAQRRRPRLPAILLTGFATNAAEIAIGGAMRGAFTLLRKPIEGRTLAERVAMLLEGAAAAGEK